MKVDARLSLLLIGLAVWGSYKIHSTWFGPAKLLVFGTGERLALEVQQGKDAPLHFTLEPGAPLRIDVDHGPVTLDATRPGGRRSSVQLTLGANETWVAPVDADQCFVLGDFSDKAAPRVEQRFVDGAPFRLGNAVHATLRELPATPAKKDSHKVLEAMPCDAVKADDDAALIKRFETPAQVPGGKPTATRLPMADKLKADGWTLTSVADLVVLTHASQPARVMTKRALATGGASAESSYSLTQLDVTFEPVGEVSHLFGGKRVYFVLSNGTQRLGLTPALLAALGLDDAQLDAKVAGQLAGRIGPVLLQCLEHVTGPTPCGEPAQAPALLVSLGPAMGDRALDVFIDADGRLRLSAAMGGTPPRSVHELVGRIVKQGGQVRWE